MSGDGVDGGKPDGGDGGLVPSGGGLSKEGGKGLPGQGRSYSQAEVDALVTGKLQGYAGVDVEEYRALKSDKVKREREALEKRGDFEKILAQTVREKDEVIGLRDKDIAALGEQLRTIRVDNALLAAASAAKAISPAQIVTLLKGSVHYDQKSDSVEVRENGAPLYRGGGSRCRWRCLCRSFCRRILIFCRLGRWIVVLVAGRGWPLVGRRFG